MIRNEILHREAFAFLKERASDLFFVLAKEGTIVDANRYARNFTGRGLTGEHFREIIVDFTGEFEIENIKGDPSAEQLIHISSSAGLPQSFYFTFKRVADHIIAFGRLDAEELEKIRTEMLILNQELNNSTRMLLKKKSQLQDALAHVKTLQGIVPICSHCHNIRNDKQIWDKLEAYLSKHTDAKFSHGICPDCAKKFYPDMDLYEEDGAK